MKLHSSALVAGLLCLSAAVVVPMAWLAAGAAGQAECQRSCGDVEIPFPFGMGPGDHCGLLGFEILCKDTDNGVHKPFMVTINKETKAKEGVVEVLNISLQQGQAKVLHPISSYCYDAASQKMVPSIWNWRLFNYSFSSSANKFTVVGCRALAYIGDTRENSVAEKYQTGCVSMCFNHTISLNTCSGMGCCQTTIPNGLQYYQVWFDEGFMNISGIDAGADLYGRCSFAVLMDSSNFTSLSTSARSNNSSPEFIDDVNSLSQFFNSSRSGKAPVVLDWSIGHDDCKTALLKNPAGYACVSANSLCSDAASGRGYICKCKEGFDSNPYQPNGCQDINECNHLDKYRCFGDCRNKIGSFDCFCPRGTKGNASIEHCKKDPFGRGTWITAGILVILLIGLVVYLSIEVFRNKENKKRQRYFEQHGGQMLMEILKREGNIPFKFYDRGDLVKATGDFHKDNIIGEGAHGTVYKAILGDATIAVKRCKQIDETRTSEFVRELVVLCLASHPNVVKLLGCCLHFEAPMLVYEFVPNGTLSILLHGRPRRRVTLPTRLRIAAETAEALADLHSPPHRTLHGDIKPENILLGEGWIAKVSDFGCSTINDNVQVVPKGTLAYLDPEFLKDFQITENSDVYSFGVVLIELLTGKNPQARECKKLTKMFQDSMENGTLGDLLDADIVEEGSMGLIHAAAKLVSQCIAAPGTATERPAMGQVAVELRRLSDQMPESPEVRVALEVEGASYSYTTSTEGQTTGFFNLTAGSTQLAR